MFIRPRTSRALASATVCFLISSTVSARQRKRRNRTGAIARVDTGFLDVLHHADNDRPLSVANGVDVDFDRIFEELVDQDRVIRAGLDSIDHVTIEAVLVVDNLHRSPAQHKARAHHDRVADPLGDLPRLFDSRSPRRSEAA